MRFFAFNNSLLQKVAFFAKDCIIPRTPYKRWSKEEILAIIRLEHELGFIVYDNGDRTKVDIEQLFFEYSGSHRASGCIYMAYWRYKQGKYDRLLFGKASKKDDIAGGNSA